SVGGYSDWVEQSARSAALQVARKPEQKAAEPVKGKDSREARGANRTVKLSYKEQRELDGLPERIAALETEQKAISAQLEDGSL
ncbi:ABC transporter ATP-binding protein, partial [Pseudomonas sp. GW460-13]